MNPGLDNWKSQFEISRIEQTIIAEHQTTFIFFNNIRSLKNSSSSQDLPWSSFYDTVITNLVL
jgi:hypothetical protein